MKQKTVFIVLEDNAYDCDQSIRVFAYSNKEKAIEKKNKLIEESNIREEIDSRYICNEDDTSFEAYLDGEYAVNHYVVSVKEEEIRG